MPTDPENVNNEGPGIEDPNFPTNVIDVTHGNFETVFNSSAFREVRKRENDRGDDFVLRNADLGTVKHLLAKENVGPLSSITTKYNSYAGVDIVATILVPGEKTDLTLGELQTISYSIHRENSPVRLLGSVNPAGFVKGPRCLPETEKVLVEGRGYISIKDVEAGDFVQSSGATYDRVLGSYNQGVKKCFKLRLESGYTLMASYDHPISTENRGWVEMSSLQPKTDKVHVVGISPCPNVDYPISNELLTLVALMLGDGTSHKYVKKSGSVEHRLALSIADTEMDSIGYESAIILSKLNIPFKDHRSREDKCISRRISVCLKDNAKTDWRLRKYNELHQSFLDLDMYGKYSHDKVIPQEFLTSLSGNQIKLFLSYLFATDGCYSVSKDYKYIEARYDSTSEELIDGMRLLLSKIGIQAIKSSGKKVGDVGGRSDIISRRDSFRLVISNSLDLLKFIDRIGIFGKDSQILGYVDLLRTRINHTGLNIGSKDFCELLREAVTRQGKKMISFKKHNIYNYRLRITPHRALVIASEVNDELFSYQINTLINELIASDVDLRPTKIVSVEEIGDLPVYDLEVENRHAFISNFIRVHNTIAGSLIFTQFDEYAFYRLQQYRDLMRHNLFPLADMLPPFDIILTFSNEIGMVSKQKIFGVTITDEGGTMSVDDLITEQTMTYMARGIQPLIAYTPDDYEQWHSVDTLKLKTDTNVITFRG